MNKTVKKYIAAAIVAILVSIPAALNARQLPAEVKQDTDSVAPFAEYWGEVSIGGSTGDFAPYLLGSLNYGKTPYKTTAIFDAGIKRGLDLSKRFSWGFGAEGFTGYRSGNDYGRYLPDTKEWTTHRVNPSAAVLQQLYGEVKWRGVFLTVGMKAYEPLLLNRRLSSGDLVESGNARPIPQARAGFIDFQDIPFTNGWVQIQGEVSYGVMTDDGWLKNQFNYYTNHITLDSYYSYKRCYFRTKPSQRFSVTVGMQVGAYFGGHGYYYSNGKLNKELTFSKSLSTFWKMLFPMGENGEDYYTGGSLGSWDLHARYLLRNGDRVTAYFHGPWEDGTGIGRMNGWDGIWGLEYTAARQGWIDGAVIEYLDFRNQSGPIHWDPDDNKGTDITSHATGNDNYYNQAYYNAWANYGMSLGSPYFKAPIYNLDGYPAFTCTRINGFHIGVSGHPADRLGYRILASFSRGLGRYNLPFYEPRHDFSMLFEADWDASTLLPGFSARAQIAFDKGSLRGDNFGAMLTFSYRGIIK